MKPLSIVKVAVIFSTISAAVSVHSASAFDVAGLKFGMNAVQIEEAVRNIGGGHKVESKTKWMSDTSDIPATIEYCAIIKRDPNQIRQCDDRIIVGFGQSTRTAYFITRQVTTQGTASQMDVKEGLIKKYNIDPSYFKSSTTKFMTDADGKSMPVPLNNCPEYGGSNGPPTSTSAGCGIAVQIIVYESPVKGINREYKIYATDHPLMFANLKAMQAKDQEANAMQQKKMLENTKQQKF